MKIQIQNRLEGDVIRIKKLAILTGWHAQMSTSYRGFFLPNVHFKYLKTMASLAEEVFLLCPVAQVEEPSGKECILSNVVLYPLPNWESAICALRYLPEYYTAIKKLKKLKNIDLLYVRVPDPFSWLPSFVFKGKIAMHFVGDTIDATKNNIKWSPMKKLLMISLYIPEYLLILMASRRARVYTNGSHLAKKLKKYGISAKALISSTIEENDFYFKDLLNNEILKLCYVGYLRYAKGTDILLQIGLKLAELGVPYIFNIVGDGEMMGSMKEFVERKNLTSYFVFYGHIDSWEELKKIYRESDLFIFPSRSEGSPRVVLEAMSQGLPVISTPVGSLPYVFKDKQDISFANFNDANSFIDFINNYIINKARYDMQRRNAYNKIKDRYTIDKFLAEIVLN